MIESLLSTQMIFNRETAEIYNRIIANQKALREFSNYSQVWFMILKKDLFEAEYEKALLRVVRV